MVIISIIHPMIEEIFEVEKLNKELNTDFIFNMSN